MPNAAVTINCLQTLEVALQFAAQIAFDQELIPRDRVNDVVQLLRREFLRAQVRINGGLLEDPLRGRRPDAVDVRQRRFDALVGRDFNSK